MGVEWVYLGILGGFLRGNRWVGMVDMEWDGIYI